MPTFPGTYLYLGNFQSPSIYQSIFIYLDTFQESHTFNIYFLCTCTFLLNSVFVTQLFLGEIKQTLTIVYRQWSKKGLANSGPCLSNLNFPFSPFHSILKPCLLAQASQMYHILSCFRTPLHSQTATLTFPHFFLFSPHPISHYFLLITDIWLISFN